MFDCSNKIIGSVGNNVKISNSGVYDKNQFDNFCFFFSFGFVCYIEEKKKK